MKTRLQKVLISFTLVLSFFSVFSLSVFAQQPIFVGQVLPTACSIFPAGISRIICEIHNILNSIIPVLLALGVVYFIWGVVRYVIYDGEEAKKKGKDQIIYGLIGLTVIVSIWGLVAIIVNTFGLNGTAPVLSSTTACTFLNNPQAKFQDLVCYVTGILNNAVIPLIFTLAVVMFIWGVVQFVINSGEEAKKAKGREFMIWGIIALTVMLCVWGLVKILGNTFGITPTALPQVTPPTGP